MNEGITLERWAANVATWAALGALVGGIASCSFCQLRGHYELVTTIGGAVGAVAGMVMILIPPRRPRTISKTGRLLLRLDRANFLFFSNRINVSEYWLMRETIITRSS
jgi:hypothetical protein